MQSDDEGRAFPAPFLLFLDLHRPDTGDPPGVRAAGHAGAGLALDSSSLSITTRIGLLLLGALGDVLDMGVVFALSGAVNLALTLMMGVTPSVMNVERGGSGNSVAPEPG